jgi:hypothetical protein
VAAGRGVLDVAEGEAAGGGWVDDDGSHGGAAVAAIIPAGHAGCGAPTVED